MAPKTPDELREQIEKQNKNQPEGESRTAEGKKVPTPTRGDFFRNLGKAGKPDSRPGG